MGRIRTIKPEFFTDEELSNVSESAHLLAAGLLCYADDEGYFNTNHGLIRAALFPLREPSNTIHGMLSELSGIGFVELGETQDGKRWGRVVKFSTHQRVNRPSPSKIKCLAIVWESSLNTHTQLTDESLPEGKGKEWNREEEGERNAPAAPVPPSAPPDLTPVNAEPFDAEPEDNIPDGLAPMQYAHFVLTEAAIPAGYALKVKTGDAIEMLARLESCGMAAATKRLLDRMRAAQGRGDKVNGFWLEDGRWKKDSGASADAERDAFLAARGDR